MMHLLAAVVLAAPFHTIQLYNLGDEAAALERVEFLRKQDEQAYFVLETGAQGLRYKVRVGRFEDRASARAYGEARGRRWKVNEFFVAQTQDDEARQLAVAVEPLIEDRALTSGFLRDSDRARRVRSHVHNYLILSLLLNEVSPPTGLGTAAVLDTNQEDHREVFAALKNETLADAFLMYWDGNVYQVREVAPGARAELLEWWDLQPGPIRHVVFKVARGGELYGEERLHVIGWNNETQRFEAVGEIVTALDDTGEMGGVTRRYRAKATLEDIDKDQQMEVIVQQVGVEDPSAQVFDWDGRRLRALDDPAEIVERWLPTRKMSASLAASVLLGLGREAEAKGRHDDALEVWRVLLLKLADQPAAAAARKESDAAQARREKASVRVRTALKLLDAGEVAGARSELEAAVEVDRFHGPAQYHLARIAARQGDVYEALAHLRQAIRVDESYRQKLGEEKWFATLKRHREYLELTQ
jgi:tetratricopeptide (TPR) repeat protein